MNKNNRVKQIRNEFGYNQTEFGEKIKIAQTYLSQIEKGERDVTEKIAKLICLQFNVNEHWLETGEGEMFESNDNTLVEQLAKEYNLDDFGKKFVETFISLPQKHRDVIYDFTRALFEQTVSKKIPEVIVDGERITDPDEAIEAKTVIQEIREEKKATEKLSDSQLAKDA